MGWKPSDSAYSDDEQETERENWRDLIAWFARSQAAERSQIEVMIDREMSIGTLME